MKEKLQILIQNEDLTPSGLARKLDVNPPVISHILKGRNQPSYELIRKIIVRFPHVNPHWLLGDSDEMYGSYANRCEQPAASTQHELFSTSQELHDNDIDVSKSPDKIRCGSEIARIIIIYRDGTFESMTPKR